MGKSLPCWNQAVGWGGFKRCWQWAAQCFRAWLRNTSICPGWGHQLSCVEPGQEGLLSWELNWRQTPTGCRRGVLVPWLNLLTYSQAQQCFVNRPDSLLLTDFSGFFVLGESLWPPAVRTWARWCSDPSYWWTLGRAVKWRSRRSCH